MPFMPGAPNGNLSPHSTKSDSFAQSRAPITMTSPSWLTGSVPSVEPASPGVGFPLLLSTLETADKDLRKANRRRTVRGHPPVSGLLADAGYALELPSSIAVGETAETRHCQGSVTGPAGCHRPVDARPKAAASRACPHVSPWHSV